jgi:hypothetical protein
MCAYLPIYTYVSIELRNTCTYLPNNKKLTSPPHYRKRVTVYQTTEHVHISTELQKMYAYLPNYMCVSIYRTTEHVVLSIELQKTCTYLPNYRKCVPIYWTTHVYLSSYRTRVPIYRTTEHLYLSIELQTKCTYPSNYTTQHSLCSNLFMHTNHDDQQ